MDYKERSRFLEERIKRLNEIGIALSTESNTNKLFETKKGAVFSPFFCHVINP